MPIASFASKTFTVSANKVYTFDGYSRSASLNVEEQEVEGEKPSSYIKGSGLEEISFSIPFVGQSKIDISTEIDDWINILNSATPYPFIIGNRLIGRNKYLLVSVSESESKFNNEGGYFKSNIQLHFKEFVRYGAKKDNAETSTESKKTKKRDNPNATDSVSQGPQVNALEKELFG